MQIRYWIKDEIGAPAAVSTLQGLVSLAKGQTKVSGDPRVVAYVVSNPRFSHEVLGDSASAPSEPASEGSPPPFDEVVEGSPEADSTQPPGSPLDALREDADSLGITLPPGASEEEARLYVEAASDPEGFDFDKQLRSWLDDFAELQGIKLPRGSKSDVIPVIREALVKALE